MGEAIVAGFMASMILTLFIQVLAQTMGGRDRGERG